MGWVVTVNNLCKDKQLDVLELLVEGCSLKSTSRVADVHESTCRRVLLRFGTACHLLMRRAMRQLELNHIECDEMWTFVKKKGFRVTGMEPDAQVIGEFYIFLAFDEDTKLVPTYFVGRRDQTSANKFMLNLANCLQRRNIHEADDHAYKKGKFIPITRISTDAFPGYRTAVDNAFGPYVRYAQLTKNTTSNSDPFITKKVIKGEINEDEISTSLVERMNLTNRTFMKRLNRKTIAFSKKFEYLQAAVAVHFAHYNFCWRHRTLKTSPAHCAGIAKRPWRLRELYEAAMGA